MGEWILQGRSCRSFAVGRFCVIFHVGLVTIRATGSSFKV
jgi:hypothetical protein